MAHPNLPDIGDNMSDVGVDLQQKIDYAGGSDPIYIGYAKQRAETSDETWVIYKCVYSGSDLVWRQRLTGSWNNRVSLGWKT